MSLGEFLTDESKPRPGRHYPRLRILTVLQRWALGLMRWRTCQFVSCLLPVSFLQRCMLMYFLSSRYASHIDIQANDRRPILTAADSRTSYGGTERRTYNSTTGTFGGSSMGG